MDDKTDIKPPEADYCVFATEGRHLAPWAVGQGAWCYKITPIYDILRCFMYSEFLLRYTLWWTNIAMERSTIFNGKIHYKWPFSIAMLVHQRVDDIDLLPESEPGRYWQLDIWPDCIISNKHQFLWRNVLEALGWFSQISSESSNAGNPVR